MVYIEPGQLSQLGHSGKAVTELMLVGGEDSGGCLYPGGVPAHSLRVEDRRDSVSDQSGTSHSW